MVSAIILARTLGTRDFAAFSYFHLTASMLAAYAAMGMGVTASRFFAEFDHKSDKALRPLGTLWYLSIGLAVAAFVVVLIAPEDWISAGLLVPRWMLALGVLVIAAGVVPGGAIVGLEKFRQAAAVSLVSGAVMLLCIWWAATLRSPLIGMGALVAASAIQTVGESLVVVREVGRHGLAKNLHLRASEIRQIFGLAGPMLAVSLLAGSGSWLLGRLILQGATGEYEFALYTIGLQWFALGMLLPGMLARAILPRLVRSKVAGGDSGGADRRILVRRGAWLTTLVAVGMAVMGVLFGPWLISIYGGHYDAGRWFIAAFMGAAIFSGPANMIGNAIVANDGQIRWLAVTLVWLVVLLTVGKLSNSWGAWSGAAAQGAAAGVVYPTSGRNCKSQATHLNV